MGKGWMRRALPEALTVLGCTVCLYLAAGYGAQPAAGAEKAEVQPAAGVEKAGADVPLAAEDAPEEPTEERELSEELPPLTDQTQAIEAILQGATGDFLAGYCVDQTFLMWLDARYGDKTLIDLACHVLDGETDVELWYELTGSSIHVLWMQFCRDAGYQTDELESVVWQETADPGEAVFSFTGDFNFADGWYTTDYMEEQPDGLLDCISAELLERMKASDVLIMNNEFTYSEKGHSLPLAGKDYTFRADPEAVGLLAQLGVDAVTLANNHVYDYGKRGLLDTLETLENAGMPYVGAGRNIREASEALYYIVNGRKVAIVSATQIERSASYTKEATSTEPGVLKTLNPIRFLQVIEDVKTRSDYVIALVHWGTEGNLFPEMSQRRLAERYVEAGADAVIGGHPHRLQGVGYIKGVPVAYSLGNFWFSTGTLYTTVAQVVIGEDGELRLRFLPCEQRELVTRLLTGEEEREAFYRYLAAISMNVGVDAEGNVYDLQTEDDPAERIRYDSGTSTTDIRGVTDNEGNAIDIVGNRR